MKWLPEDNTERKLAETKIWLLNLFFDNKGVDV